jgi:hypothetical protein
LAVVDEVRDRVVVVVPVKGVARAVAVGVLLAAVRGRAAVVLEVRDGVVVVIVVTDVADTVALRVELVRVGRDGAVVLAIEKSSTRRTTMAGRKWASR